MTRNQEAFQKLEALYQDNAIRDRKYYPDFRRGWNALLEPASVSEEEYFPLDSDSVVVIHCDYGGLDFDFHLDQAKMADWYYQEVKRGKPLLGICLGMQLLFEKSYEYGEHRGLGLIKGVVRPIADVIPSDLKIPHIGWNALHFGEKKHPLFRYLQEKDCVYFVHSYYAADCAESVIATAEYGAELTAAVANGNVCGCQFHPEKSGDVGLNILRAFCEGGF